MERTSNAHSFLILRWNALKFFTICKRPPVLQTDDNVGMMKIVVCETEVWKGSGP